MKGAVLILRPQPGADATAERARARELEPVVDSLFTVRAVDWTPPAADGFDAILFTSANAPRHAGSALAAYRDLPAFAVGEASAAAARDAGFANVRAGGWDAAAAVAMMAEAGARRALHLSATEVAPFEQAGVAIEQVPVYAAEPAERLSDVAVAAIHAGAIVLLHSPRAAAVFADRIGERRAIARIAAISDAAAAAAGSGWAGVGVAAEPRDEALIDVAALLAAQAPPARSTPSPPSPPAPAVPGLDPDHLQRQPPRGRPWVWRLAGFAAAFLLGMGVLLWMLWRVEGLGNSLGLVADPAPVPATAAQLPVAAPAPAGDPDAGRRLAALERRLGDLGADTRQAAGNADRAEGLLVAFAARRALERGIGLGYLEGLLRERFGDSQAQAVATITAFAQHPVTLPQLQAGLVEVGPQMTGAPPGESFWGAVQNELANLVVIRRDGAPSSDPRERLERATARLEAGQVEEALREVKGMAGWENGRAWVDAAERYVQARAALDTIELAALVEPRAATAQPVQRPVATAAPPAR